MLMYINFVIWAMLCTCVHLMWLNNSEGIDKHAQITQCRVELLHFHNYIIMSIHNRPFTIIGIINTYIFSP